MQSVHVEEALGSVMAFGSFTGSWVFHTALGLSWHALAMMSKSLFVVMAGTSQALSRFAFFPFWFALVCFRCAMFVYSRMSPACFVHGLCLFWAGMQHS